MFYSVSHTEHADRLLTAGVRNILVSYHYFRKNSDFMEILKEVNKRGGLFMIDSGAFTFSVAISKTAKEDGKDVSDPGSWIDYLEEYVQFIEEHHKLLFCAANFDIDSLVGTEIVDQWNIKYFAKLEKLVNVIYVAHRYLPNYKEFERLEEYCKKFKYVGVNAYYQKALSKVAQISNKYRTRIHGFAITSFPRIKQYPMFSVDSITWHMGEVFGVTYRHDGANFRGLNHKYKNYRVADTLLMRKIGLDPDRVIIQEKARDVDIYNLEGWKGAEKQYYEIADAKLLNDYVSSYDKRLDRRGKSNHKPRQRG